jgi:hypothetical protein
MTNLFKQLQHLLPRDPLRIGTIASVDGTNGTVTCNMANGGQLTVRGTGSVSDVVYIQFGQVQGTQANVTPFPDQDV